MHAVVEMVFTKNYENARAAGWFVQICLPTRHNVLCWKGGGAVPFPVVWALGWNFPMSRILARKWAAGEYQESTATPHMNIIKRNFHVGVLTI